MDINLVEEKSYKFGQCVVKVWKTGPTWHPYPWRFSVTDPVGTEHKYAGIPNQCETKHSALMRGWWRAKWFNDGTYHKRYI